MVRGILTYQGKDVPQLLCHCSRYIADPARSVSTGHADVDPTNSPTDTIMGCARTLGKRGYLQLYFETDQATLDAAVSNTDRFNQIYDCRIRVAQASALETENDDFSLREDLRVARLHIKAHPSEDVLTLLKKFLVQRRYTIVQHDGLLAQPLGESNDASDPDYFQHVHLMRIVCPRAVTDVALERDVNSFFGEEFSNAGVSVHAGRLGETLDPEVFGSSAPQSEKGYSYIRAYVSDVRSHLIELTDFLFSKVSFHTPTPSERRLVLRSSSRRIAHHGVLILCVENDIVDHNQLANDAREWKIRKDIARLVIDRSSTGPTYYRSKVEDRRRLLVTTHGENRKGSLFTVASVLRSFEFLDRINIAEYDGNSDATRYDGGGRFGSRQVFGLIAHRSVDVSHLRASLESVCSALRVSVDISEV